MSENASWHGTLGGYTNHACRCAACRANHRAYHRAYRQRPEVKAKQRAYQRAYRQRPEVKAKQQARYAGSLPGAMVAPEVEP